MDRWGERPSAGAEFFKAHGLGNDYLVFEEGPDWAATGDAVVRVCDRWRGVGSDGIVLLLDDRTEGVYRARMFNPDGSEFERSGNGLRILGAYLAHRGLVGHRPFVVSVGGDRVSLTVLDRSPPRCEVRVEMGGARTGPEAIGLDPGEVRPDGTVQGPAGEALDVVPVVVGNPHAVVFCDEPTEARLRSWGPFLASHPSIPAGTNVQIATVDAPGSCRALIWERGVGRTSASGTSACAVAVASVASGRLAPGSVLVRMDGGVLTAEVDAQLRVTLQGPVEEVLAGRLTDGFVKSLA